VVDPRQVSLNTRKVAVLIERIVADGRTLAPADRLDLPAGTRHLEIHYAAPNFAAPERVRFEHQLEGFEPTFFRAESDRVAHYSLLGPGRYRFLVRATNEDAVWGDAASLDVSVRPYFYQTAWFYTLGASALIFAGWALAQLRVRAMRTREQELKRRVAEELAQVKMLRGMLPVCAWCKKIRDDAGYWGQIESYIEKHTEAEFTHGICPDCREGLRPSKRP
jgi:hypothetical protein